MDDEGAYLIWSHEHWSMVGTRRLWLCAKSRRSGTLRLFRGDEHLHPRNARNVGTPRRAAGVAGA